MLWMAGGAEMPQTRPDRPLVLKLVMDWGIQVSEELCV